MTREDAMIEINQMLGEATAHDHAVCYVTGEDAEALEMAYEALQERRQGYWIENDDYTCSVCGFHFVLGDGAYNYCPNCGAEMSGEEE